MNRFFWPGTRLFCAFACGWFICIPLIAKADASNSVHIEDLTTKDVSAALRPGKTTIIIPIGGTEQKGPHMGTGNRHPYCDRAHCIPSHLRFVLFG
jgi:hypothetical protein